ncbi:hypothetical protein HK405_015276, partial [Cladochytrium tenue]
GSLGYYVYDLENPNNSRPLESGPYFDLLAPFYDVIKAKDVFLEVGENLKSLCLSAGLSDVEERVAVFPVGWNGPLGNLAAADVRQLVTGASRRLFMSGRDDETYGRLINDALKQA